MGQQTSLRMLSEIVAKPGVKKNSKVLIQNNNQRSTLMKSISGNIAESSAAQQSPHTSSYAKNTPRQPVASVNTGVEKFQLPDISIKSRRRCTLSAIQNYERFIEGEEDRVSIIIFKIWSL